MSESNDDLSGESSLQRFRRLISSTQDEVEEATGETSADAREPSADFDELASSIDDISLEDTRPITPLPLEGDTSPSRPLKIARTSNGTFPSSSSLETTQVSPSPNITGEDLTDAPASTNTPAAKKQIRKKRAKTRRLDDQTFGRAIQAGIAAVRVDADILVFLDGDGSDSAEFIPDLVSPIVARQAVFVLGSRVRGPREPGSLAPQQLIAARVGRLLLRLVYGASFTDLSPFRAIRRDELRRLGMREETYGWNLEMLMRIAAARLPALEIAVGQRRRIGGVSKVSGNLFAVLKAAWSISATFVRLALELRHRETRRQ